MHFVVQQSFLLDDKVGNVLFGTNLGDSAPVLSISDNDSHDILRGVSFPFKDELPLTPPLLAGGALESHAEVLAALTALASSPCAFSISLMVLDKERVIQSSNLPFQSGSCKSIKADLTK